MTISEPKRTIEPDDAHLVAESLDGHRDAFRKIVDRYKTLICSLAYSATGNMSRSEDVAQETFISAWKDLRHLREPNKLRAWLCGIVRNRVLRSARDDGREPALDGIPLEEAPNFPTVDMLPSEQAISREEEAILWRSLEKVPEIFREPLILFYREHKSVERVAAELELSGDVVRQRLSRGRKLLREEVQAFVENTLRRTAPGDNFSGVVLAALPAAAGAATTAGVGLGAKGKAVALSGLLNAWLLPLLGILAGFAAQWAMFSGGNTKRERRFNRKLMIAAWVIVLVFSIGGQQAVRYLGYRMAWNDRTAFGAMAGFWWLYAMAITTWTIVLYRRIQRVPMNGAAPGEIHAQATTPMTQGRRMLATVGTNLMLFSGVITLTWSTNDRPVAGGIAGVMLALSAWQYSLSRGKSGTAQAVAYIRQLASSCGVMLLIFNLRFTVWAAAWYGVKPGDLHNLVPVAAVPLLTAALAIWAGALLFLTKPKSSAG